MPVNLETLLMAGDCLWESDASSNVNLLNLFEIECRISTRCIIKHDLQILNHTQSSQCENFCILGTYLHNSRALHTLSSIYLIKYFKTLKCKTPESNVTKNVKVLSFDFLNSRQNATLRRSSSFYILITDLLGGYWVPSSVLSILYVLIHWILTITQSTYYYYLYLTESEMQTQREDAQATRRSQWDRVAHWEVWLHQAV